MKRGTFIVMQAVWLTVGFKRPCNVNEQSSRHACDIHQNGNTWWWWWLCLIIPSQVLQTTSMEIKTAFMPVWEPDKIFPYFYNHPNYVSANHLLLFCYNVDLFSTMTHLELVHDAWLSTMKQWCIPPPLMQHVLKNISNQLLTDRQQSACRNIMAIKYANLEQILEIKYMHSWKKYSNIGILFKSGQLSSSTLMRPTCIDATSANKYWQSVPYIYNQQSRQISPIKSICTKWRSAYAKKTSTIEL